MDCVITQSTTTEPQPCTNVFEYLIEQAYLGAKKNSFTIAQVLNYILNKGIIVSDCNLCCLACTDGSAYSLSSFEDWALLVEATGLKQCCPNIFAGVDKYVEFVQIRKNEELYIDVDNPCCNNFDNCVDELICWLNENSIENISDYIKQLLEIGIVESNTKSSSSICDLVNALKKYDSLLTSNHISTPYASSKQEIISTILQYGVTITCLSDGTVHVSGVSTYLLLAEVLGTLNSINHISIKNTTTTTTLIQ